mgnify:CR=1 FL=1
MEDTVVLDFCNSLYCYRIFFRDFDTKGQLVQDNSLAFGLIATYHLGWLGYSTVTSVVVHLMILIPILVTNAVFIDAERDGEQWLVEWKEERSKYRLFRNRLKTKNMVRWNPDSEA